MNGLNLTNARVWRDGKCVGKNVSNSTLAEAILDDETLVWADLVDPSADDLMALASELGIGETAVEDALAPHERAKVTRHDTHLFFTVYAAHLDPPGELPDERLRLSRISGFLLPRGLVTVRVTDPKETAFDMAAVERRWDDSEPLIAEAGASALIHALLDYVVDGHFETIQQLDDALENLEDVLFAEERTGKDFVRTTYELRKDLVSLRRVVLPMREVVNALMRHRGRPGNALDPWYDDLYDHVLRASEWTESLRDMITTVFETNLSLQDARLNTIMKQLAAWAAIIAVPTAVTGWFGQNIPYPGFQAQSGLWMSVVLMVGLSVGLWWVFKRRDWL